MNDYLHEYKNTICDAMDSITSDNFRAFVEMLRSAYMDDRQIFVMGNGGSAATANHFVCDFGKNAVAGDHRRFRMISLSDNVEKLTALGNDFDFSQIFSQQLKNLMREGDVLVAISASGNSPNLIRACEYAKTQKASIAALTGFDGGKLKTLADVNFIVPLKSYEQIEDVHMIITHMIVYYVKNHPELLIMG